MEERNYPKGIFFENELLQKIRNQFFYVAEDQNGNKRLFFDNAGGSFRLKKALEGFYKVDAICNCPERKHKTSLYLGEIVKQGKDDIHTIFNTSSGNIFMSITASKAIFEITGAIAENVQGTNIVTTMLEHPSAYDAAKFYADKTGKELRVAKTNPVTGGVDVDEIIGLIDKDTCLLSVIYASNISGAILDLDQIVKKARQIKPDLHIICDAVQHIPHSRVNIDDLKLDAINFAPYKFFGVRGSGIAYVSDRVAVLPHHKLEAKPADEWNLGSPAPSHYLAITEIVNYVCWIGSQFIKTTNRNELFTEGMNRIELHERALLNRLLYGSNKIEGLRDMKGVKVLFSYSDLTTHDLILAFEIEGVDYEKAVSLYEEEDVIVYERVATSLYSKRIVESFGLDGAIRVSPLHCHDIDDIDTFLNITKKIISKTSKS